MAIPSMHNEPTNAINNFFIISFGWFANQFRQIARLIKFIFKRPYSWFILIGFLTIISAAVEKDFSGDSLWEI